jgi:iron complex outermembrane receptor protein
MKKAALLILFCSAAFAIKAQQDLRGKITDSTGTGIEFVTVAILNTADSSLVQSTLTDVNGSYTFTNIAIGKFILKSFAVGYAGNYFPFTVDVATQIPNIILKTKGINLNEVNITALKKNIEFKNGNVIVNVEDSPLALGNTAYDLLMKLPGVSLDENDNISIQGRPGVKILIDDRVQQMSPKQLINLLKTINSSNIEKVEVLKNPPVKYDASGTGGLINFRTKKVKLLGFSGNATLEGSQGVYPVYDGALSLNYKGKNFAVFSDVIVMHEKYYHDHRFIKKVDLDTAISEMDQQMDNKDGGNFYSLVGGFDWYANKKNTIGFKVNCDGGTGIENNSGKVKISDNSLGYKEVRFTTYVPNPWRYSNFNLNAEHIFDTLGSKLAFSADYAPNYDLYKGSITNNFFDGYANEILQPIDFKLSNTLHCNVLSSKLDYQKLFLKGAKLEAGLKGSELEMISDYDFYNKNNLTGDFIVDSAFTNKFTYREQIMAGYVNFSKEVKHFNFQAGLRGENTHIIANSKNGEFTYGRDYFNLFPVANITYSKNEKHNLQLSYNRRINRPTYNSFNPYRSRTSLYMTGTGNPNLMPEYSNTIEFTHTYKGELSNSFSYSRVDNFLLDLTLQNDSSRETTGYQQNLKDSYTLGYSLFFQKNLTKWWQFNFSGSASYSEYSGKVINKDYFSTGYFSRCNLSNTFLVKENTKVELGGVYIGPSYVGVWSKYPRWSVSAAVKQTLLKGKLNIVCGVDDIFFKMIGNNSMNLNGQNWLVTATNDTRRFKLSFIYNFGKVKVEERDIRSNEEEKGRLGH